MDDMGQKLNDLLNSPDAMAKIQNMMASLGLGGTGGGSEASPSAATPPPETAPAPAPTTSAPQAVQPDSGTTLGGLGAMLGGADMSALMKLAPLLGAFNQEDDNTALLKALRPHLHGERESRVDDAIKIMHLVKLLPLLQDKGIL